MDLVRETARSLAVSEENHSEPLKSYVGREEMLIPLAFPPYNIILSTGIWQEHRD